MLQQLRNFVTKGLPSTATRLLSGATLFSRSSYPIFQSQQAFMSRGVLQRSPYPITSFPNSIGRIPATTSLLSKLGCCVTAISIRSSHLCKVPKHIRDWKKLMRIHKEGPHKKFRPPRQPLGGAPMLKGVVLKTLIKKPKKPNSANRKCVLVRLSNGDEKVAYVPGIGHNLQEHNVVLVRVGRLRDTPGVKLKCIRGKYDLAHVIKPTKT